MNKTHYPDVVPKSAVFRDDEGEYILEVVTKETPLGPRYYVDRVAVYVIEKDLRTGDCAITCPLQRGSAIVSATKEELSSKDMVVLKEDTRRGFK